VPGLAPAPLSMRWQDTNDKILSSAEVCRAVTDRSRNHHLDGAGLLKHHTVEPLVRWAFQPGRAIDGTMRSLPPLTHDQFVEPHASGSKRECRARRIVEAGGSDGNLQAHCERSAREVTVDPGTPLLWVLRERAEADGHQIGCGIAACGACTVHLAGVATRSCVVPVSLVGNRPIVSIEGIASDPVGRAVQEVWVSRDVVQCGYCQKRTDHGCGRSAEEHPKPTDTNIEESMGGNLCAAPPTCASRIDQGCLRTARVGRRAMASTPSPGTRPAAQPAAASCASRPPPRVGSSFLSISIALWPRRRVASRTRRSIRGRVRPDRAGREHPHHRQPAGVRSKESIRPCP